MSLSSTTNRLVYVGDGSSATFSFPYYFFNQADLKVYLYDTISGSSLLQVLNTNYTISGSVNAQGLYSSGGNVVMASAIISTTYIAITRDPSEVQNFVLQQNAVIPSASLTQQLDYLTLLIQRQNDKVSRAVTLPDGFAGTFDPTLPPNMGAFAANGLFLNSSATGWTYGPFANSYIPNTLIYAPTGSSIASLGGGAAGLVLQSNGSSAPSWAAVSLSGSSVSGTLSLANGGTGGLTPRTWGVVYASSATELATTDPAPVGKALISNASSAPTFQQLNFATAGSGFVPIANGGTGGNTYTSGSGAFIIANNLSEVVNKTTAFGNIFPATALGDTLYGGAAGAATILPGVTNVNGVSQFYSQAGDGLGGSQPPLWVTADTVIANLSSAITILKGGTGQITKAAAFNALSPTTTTGDIIIHGSSATPVRLATGATGTFLQSQGAGVQPTWVAQNYGSSALLVTNNLSDVASASTAWKALSPAGLFGDTIYTGSAGFGARLAAGVSGQFLTTGGAGAAPAWANGLSNPMTTFGDTLFSGSANVTTRLAAGVSGQVLQTNGSSAAPSWATFTQTPLGVVTKTASYNATTADQVILCNSGAMTINLFSVAGNSGRTVQIKKVDAGAGIVSIVGSAATIDGSSILLIAQNESYDLVCDGTNWQVLDYYFQPQGFRGYTGSGTITSSFTGVGWQFKDYDTSSILVGTTGVATINRAGRWQLNAQVGQTFTTAAGAVGAIAVFRNSKRVMTNQISTALSDNTVTPTISEIYNLALNDTIQIQQLSTETSPNYYASSAAFSMMYLGQ